MEIKLIKSFRKETLLFWMLKKKTPIFALSMVLAFGGRGPGKDEITPTTCRSTSYHNYTWDSCDQFGNAKLDFDLINPCEFCLFFVFWLLFVND